MMPVNAFNFLTWILFLSCVLLNANCKLYQVVSLIRHGAKYPQYAYNHADKYFEKWGELSAVGLRQQQNFGKKLSREYIQMHQFLSPTYNPEEIEIFASRHNRSIESAIAQAQGLYPEGNGLRLSHLEERLEEPKFQRKNLQPNLTDFWFNAESGESYALPFGHQNKIVKFNLSLIVDQCDRTQEIMDINIAKAQYQQFYQTFKPFLTHIGEIFKIKDFSFQNMTDLFDTLQSQRFLQEKIHPSLTQEKYKKLELLRSWRDYYRYSGTLNDVFTSGAVSKMLFEFQNRIQNLNSKKLKWTFLNVHDSHIVNFASKLNISSHQCIQDLLLQGKTQRLNCQTHTGFCSNIIVELHSNDEQYFYVMIRYEGKYMNLCERAQIACSFQELKDRLRNGIIEDISPYCGNVFDPSRPFQGLLNEQNEISKPQDP